MVFDIIDVIMFNRFCIKKVYLICFFNLLIFIFKFYNVVSVKKSCILCIEFNVFELVV